MKRLNKTSKRMIKKASNYEYTLVANGVWWEESSYGGNGRPYKQPIQHDFEWADDLCYAINEDSDINFVDYMDHGNTEEVAKKLESINLLGDDGQLFINIIAKEELTKEDKDIIYDYMNGQLADGWGEGFEQHEIAEYETQEEVEYEEEVEVYDEEEDDYYTDYETYYDIENITMYIYVSFWGDGATLEWL